MEKNDFYKHYRFPELPSEHAEDARHPEHRTDQVQETAKPDAATIESQAYEEGYAQGHAETLPAEKEKAKPISNVLSTSAVAMEKHRGVIQQKIPQDAVQLAINLTREIVQREVINDANACTRTFKDVIKMAGVHDQVKIKIHPDDNELVKSIIQEEFPDSDYRQKFDLITDRSINRNGCLVETNYGIIDARIDHQLTSFTEELNHVIMSQPSHENNEKAAEELFKLFYQTVETTEAVKSCGHVTQVVGLVVEANGPVAQLGCVCEIHGKENEPPVKAEVLGFRDQTVLMMPLEEIRSIGPGSRVVAKQKNAAVAVGNQLLGRVIDGLGQPMDGLGALSTEVEYPIYGNPINPLLRQRIRKPLDIGVRAINGLLTIGCGQRMGIFAGSGVGKSVLMGIIARKSQADVNVIALIGERGRELNEFIEKELGEEGLQKSVVVVATSDHLPLVRVRGAFVATAIAEFFRDQGMQVNLMMDSLTRFAMAQREIGLALGEPPTTKGYTPSVFTLLPKLLERAGTSDHEGAITGLYTVLVEGDDMNEPIADAARSILDGHIVLSRELADQNHYPAIDVLRSVSRVMEDIAGLQHKHSAGRLKELLATYRKAEDLINIGAYVAGSNPKIDQAIERIEHINKYLRQDIQDNVHYDDSLSQLENIMQAAM